MSQSRSTTRTWAQAIRLPVVTAAVCLMVLVSTAAPSAAEESSNGPKLQTNPSGPPDGPTGSVWFAHQGDHLYLCDHKVDGKSVVVYVDYTRQSTGRPHSIASWYTGGPNTHNGCKDVNIDAVEGTRVSYLVCRGDYGKQPPASTCSGLASGVA